MKVLILGGTQFVGRHIAQSLHEGGHAVTVFTRGRTPDELPSEIERLHGDRDEGAAGLLSLQRRQWDACVDVSGYTARQVRPSTELLRDAVRQYVFVSAVSVYGDAKQRPVTEDHPRVPPEREDVTELNQQTYGRLKVTCENIIAEMFEQRCCMLRPQILVGPHDPSGRYAYWIRRVANGGEVLAPGDGSDHVQFLDVRDFARFAKIVVERQLGGAFNLAGPRITWRGFMELLGAKNLVWVSAIVIRAAGVTEFELPLYRHEHGERAGLMDVSSARAQAAGLTLSDPAKTVESMRNWMNGREISMALLPERERALIEASRGIRCSA